MFVEALSRGRAVSARSARRGAQPPALLRSGGGAVELVVIGAVCLALRRGGHPGNVQEMIEVLSLKIGVVLLVLGAMHFFNLFVFSKIRRRALLKHQPPPVVPDASVQVKAKHS